MSKPFAKHVFLFLVGTSLFLTRTIFAEEKVELKIGDAAPNFECMDDEGKLWKLKEHLGKKYVVIYFYPADFTTGCINQAESWRDNLNALAKSEVEVVGISADSVESHRLFKESWKLNFTLLSDEKALTPKKFGVPVRGPGKVRPRGPDRKFLLDENGDRLWLERKATFVRWTFVVGLEGKIIYINRRVRPAADSGEVLKFIRNLKAKSSK